jgi:formate hydrogenlyase subunit 3/multisubunit Na+/H+ antiporter MnhD subunit
MMLTVTTLLPGEKALHTVILVLGGISALTGGILALFMQNIKTILAYSSLSQMGLLLMGIGCAGMLGSENGLAVEGVLLHAVNHMVFKMVLFLSAGVLIHQTHRMNLSDLRGAGEVSRCLKPVFSSGRWASQESPAFRDIPEKPFSTTP